MTDTTEARLARATFADCPLCLALYDAGPCRGHDEAEALRMIPLQRLLLHNAAVAALYAHLREITEQLRRNATPKNHSPTAGSGESE